MVRKSTQVLGMPEFWKLTLDKYHESLSLPLLDAQGLRWRLVRGARASNMPHCFIVQEIVVFQAFTVWKWLEDVRVEDSESNF